MCESDVVLTAMSEAGLQIERWQGNGVSLRGERSFDDDVRELISYTCNQQDMSVKTQNKESPGKYVFELVEKSPSSKSDENEYNPDNDRDIYM